MGSAGHSGCVIRRGVRRGPAQWAGPISTRERVFLWKDKREDCRKSLEKEMQRCCREHEVASVVALFISGQSRVIG